MKYYILIVTFIIFSISCNSEQNTDKSQSPKHKYYGIEKAKVKYSTDLMGVQSESVLYFKDYGNLKITDSKAAYMGHESHSRQFTKDGYLYILDMNNKSGSKMPPPQASDSVLNIENIDFDNIPQKIRTKYEINKTGTENILGKECTIYSMKIRNTAHRVISVWKNIPMRIEFIDEGIHIKTEAVELQESPDLPDSMFEVPSNFEIKEFNPAQDTSNINKS